MYIDSLPLIALPLLRPDAAERRACLGRCQAVQGALVRLEAHVAAGGRSLKSFLRLVAAASVAPCRWGVQKPVAEWHSVKELSAIALYVLAWCHAGRKVM